MTNSGNPKVASFAKVKFGRVLLGIIRSFLNFAAFGFYGRSFDTRNHSVIIPELTYSPWIEDVTFKKYWDVARNNTRLDVYRAYGLWQALNQVRHLKGDILEVGVWRGGSGSILAGGCKELNLKSTVFLCDTYAGVVKASEKDLVFRGGEVPDTSPQHVENIMRGLGLDNTKIVIGIFPDESGSSLITEKISLCHIDVDTYLSAKDTVEWVWPRLPVGGVVIFDDYGHVQCNGITNYVNDLSALKDRFIVHNLNGQAWMIRLV